jgi:membrane protein implicated in regulation of membrane protease activity
MAVFSLNMLYITFSLPNVYSTIVFIFAFGFPLAIFFVSVPWTLTMVAFLSSCGSGTNRALLRRLSSDFEVTKAEMEKLKARKMQVRKVLEEKEMRRFRMTTTLGLVLEAAATDRQLPKGSATDKGRSSEPG